MRPPASSRTVKSALWEDPVESPSKPHDIEAVIAHVQGLGLRNLHCQDVYAVALVLVPSGFQTQYVQVGTVVPAGALHLLQPGNTVPVRPAPDSDVAELVIDWDAALTNRKEQQR
jgi:hypothetical protein